MFMLTIPMAQGNSMIALLTFIGGFAAATGMIIVESLALSTMVMNSLVMPAIFRFNEMKGFPLVILNLKRIVILASVFLGYIFAVSIGEFYSLVDIGLKSFEAMTIFAPSIIIGLVLEAWEQDRRSRRDLSRFYCLVLYTSCAGNAQGRDYRGSGIFLNDLQFNNSEPSCPLRITGS